jgi:hypothetical protein
MAATQAEVQQIQLDAKGLFTNPNDLSKVPPGALLDATNIVIDRDGIMEQRRGVKAYGVAVSLGSDVVDSMHLYQNRLILHYGSTFALDGDGAGGSWPAYTGSYGIPTGAYAVRSVQSNKNVYFSTSSGIVKLDSISGTLKAAGVPQGLDGSGSTTGSGWFTNSTQVAYRVVFGYVDANNNTILGAPSGRIIVANNSGGATNVSLTFTLPSGLTTSYFYQVYRSPLSVDLSTTPTDECQLILQSNLTAGNILAGTVTLTDSVPDALKGATIYTATSQQGISQSNYQPPVSVDMTAFKGFVFYANCKFKQTISLSLLSVGGANGIVANDTITIAGTAYTAKASENAAAAQFLCDSSGTPSANIDNTARSLVHVINTYASNTTVYAYYVSGFNDLPGQILIQERGIGAATFTMSVSRASAWYFPSGTSTNESKPGSVFVAKYEQPEAVPIVNELPIGSADKSVLRIIALRNSVFVFKEDGVFRITGDDLSSFASTPWDTTVVLRAPEAAVLLNNQIYAFTTQGEIAVSETGSAIVSRPIEKTLLQLSASQFTTFDAVTFAIGYESDRKYILNTVESVSDTASPQSYVFNYITNTQTRWTFPYKISAGILNTHDNKLYVASADPTSKFIYQERKSFTETDYADNEFAVTITSSTGKTVNVNDTSSLLVDDSLSQGIQRSVITAIISATQVTVEDTITWAAGAATVYRPTTVSVEWAPVHGGNPTVTKLFKEFLFYFSIPDFNHITVAFNSNFSQGFESVTLTPITSSNYGTEPFGTGTFGGGYGDTQPIRTWAPMEKCRANWVGIKMTKKQALTTFALDGISVAARAMGYRFR